MRLLRPRRVLRAAAAVAVLASCGSDDDTVADQRGDQVRAAAAEAGLPDEVADVLALAARGMSATYRITYPGTEGAAVVVSQEPPNHRVDIVVGQTVVESRVLRDGVSYRCTAPTAGRAGEELDCRRVGAAVQAPGAFTDEALEEFTATLAGSIDRFDLNVEDRTIADTPATCLVTAPNAGTEIDGTGPNVDTLCLSPEGAPLLTDADGERVVADTYTVEVPDGTFDV